MGNSIINLIVEIIGRFVLLLLFFIACKHLSWWSPLLIAPVYWQLWNVTFGLKARIYLVLPKLIMDFLSYAIGIGYLVYSIISFGIHLGHWYGWVVGAIVGVIIVWLIGLLWPRRWHFEHLEGNL